MEYKALISPCDSYRYSLVRRWDATRPTVCFVMLNPSTADSTQDDATIRRCINFAKAWGFGSLEVANLFSYRATKVPDLKKAPVPNGPESDFHMQAALSAAGLIVAAWGNHGTPERVEAVLGLMQNANKRVHCLGMTKSGAPRHPLYVPGYTKPVLYTSRNSQEGFSAMPTG
jgi:hypothetical protein